jgi:hypothetical protein
MTVKVVVGALVLAPLLYITSCSVISHVHDGAFVHVNEGDTEVQVIAAMGRPSDREWAGGRHVPQYGAPDCASPCVQRLWYLNRLSLVGEAWMIELDGKGRVVQTSFVESP